MWGEQFVRASDGRSRHGEFRTRRTGRLVALLVAVSLLLVACGDDDDSASDASGSEDSAETVAPDTGDDAAPTEEPDAPTSTAAPASPEVMATPEGPPAQLRIATYNAGLGVGFVPLTEERQPHVAEAIAAIDADIVVLQEIWAPEAVAAVRAATEGTFAQAVFPEPVPDLELDDPSCTADDLADLEACITENCADAPPDELVGCVLANCGSQYAAIPEDCQSCIAANVGNTIEEAVQNCTTASSAYAYGGSVGIGLLTNAVILETDVFVLESSVNRRAVLHAVVETEEFGTIHVFATHLTALLPDVPYPGDGTWEEEQARQIEAMLDYIETRTEPGDAVVLVGDLNTGPAGDGYEAEAPANYARLAAAMDANVYPESENALCTYCGDNPLRGGEPSVVIDHVLTRGLDADGEAQRILDEPLVIEVDGEDVTTALSDHFGVLLTLTKR